MVKAVPPDLDDAALRRYLLGLLPEAEAEPLEEAYFARPEVLETLRGVEDDLLDDYAAGRLSPGEKGAFEGRYLASPRLRDRVVAARALRLASADRLPARMAIVRAKPWVARLAIAAGVLLAVGALWRWPPRPREVTSASHPMTSLAPQTAPASTPGPGLTPASTEPPRHAATTPVVLALSPVLLRGEGQPAGLRIPPGTETVVLELEGDPAALPPSRATLEASVKTVEGEPVWRGEARRAAARGSGSSPVASAAVPAARLGPGDYLVSLSVRSTADGELYSYFFRVRR
ncbi:MAG: hypothetical protein DMF80_13425 [Acidobacteria bacterium]|nr:MAG: hypothetical protein DMF80_13425 [Acidobacteriota bacterium]